MSEPMNQPWKAPKLKREHFFKHVNAPVPPPEKIDTTLRKDNRKEREELERLLAEKIRAKKY